jgi:DNA-binding transcriptional MerR regulator
VTAHHPIRKVLSHEPTVIPDKLYFRIGDVAKLCDVPAYVLRFWETEFPQLKPNKGGTGQRLYRKRDVEMALRIKSLLYDQGYTIPGARQAFATESKPKDSETPQLAAAPVPAPEPVPTIDVGETIRQEAHRRDQLSTLRAELRALADQLARPVTDQPAADVPAASAPLEAKTIPLRARLTLEPRPDPKAPRLIDQGDLFSTE